MKKKKVWVEIKIKPKKYPYRASRIGFEMIDTDGDTYDTVQMLMAYMTCMGIGQWYLVKEANHKYRRVNNEKDKS